MISNLPFLGGVLSTVEPGPTILANLESFQDNRMGYIYYIQSPPVLWHCIVLVSRINDAMVEGRASICAPVGSSCCNNVLQPMKASVYCPNILYNSVRSPLSQSMLHKSLLQATSPTENGRFEIIEFHETNYRVH